MVALNSAAARATNTSSISRWRTSITAVPRPRARKPTAFASASIALFWTSSTGLHSARRSIWRSTSCRPTSTLGSSNIMNSAPIRAAGASVRPRCRPSLTRCQWRRRNSWLLDDRQHHIASNSQHRLSGQVSTNTAKATGISLRSVQRIWQTYQLQPHRIRTFKHSRDPSFAAKLADIVGLYVDPPAHAVVLSLDEKSQIQALDRTQPGLPIKPGRCQTMTHDYKRHGTTTLFAALSVLDGVVIGQC